MRKPLFSLSSFALTLCFAAAPALAHDEHCHTKAADGKLEDAKDAVSKKSCAEKGGSWTDHGHGDEAKPAK